MALSKLKEQETLSQKEIELLGLDLSPNPDEITLQRERMLRIRTNQNEKK